VWLGKLFNRPGRRSADPGDLRAFLGAQGAFVAQKTVLDYCRVKAGRNEKKHFADPDFQVALQHCRWQTFFAALADVTAMAEAWLRPQLAPEEVPALAAALAALHAEALAAEPPPEPERAGAVAAGEVLRTHLAALQAAPPLPAHKLPMLAEAPLFATLPIAPEQRVGETPAIRGALRFHLVSAQQEMERAFDAPALARALVAGQGAGAVGTA
jgi:hypothetical protein